LHVLAAGNLGGILEDLNFKTSGVVWGTPLREATDDKRPEVAQYLRGKGARE